VPAALGGKANVVAEPGNCPIDPLNAETVAGTSIAVAVEAHTPHPEPNFLSTCRMSLQRIEHLYCFISGQEVSRGMCILDLAQMFFSSGLIPAALCDDRFPSALLPQNCSRWWWSKPVNALGAWY